MNNFQGFSQQSCYFQLPWVPIYCILPTNHFGRETETEVAHQLKNGDQIEDSRFQKQLKNKQKSSLILTSLGTSEMRGGQDGEGDERKHREENQKQNKIKQNSKENNENKKEQIEKIDQELQNSRRKATWTHQQEQKLIEYVQLFGEHWKQISQYFPNRNPKQIRQRYLNYLRPNLSNEKWTEEEDIQLMDLTKIYGHRWKMIEKKMKSRSQNQIKNRFYGHIKKLLQEVEGKDDGVMNQI